MKCMDYSLCFILDVISTCIIVHNICILSKDAFDKTWIEDVEKKLQSQLTQGELREGSKLCGEKASLTNFRGVIESHPNMVIPGDQGYENMEIQTFFIKEDEMDEDLLNEITNQHITLTKTLSCPYT